MSQGASLELGVGVLNVGAMTRKGGELVNMMEQKKVDELLYISNEQVLDRFGIQGCGSYMMTTVWAL